MKKKEGKHPSTERWLLSYADFITLLMIFFIVMYASSNIDADKYKAITQSLGISLGGSVSILDSGDGTLNLNSKDVVGVETQVAPNTPTKVNDLPDYVNKLSNLNQIKSEVEKYMVENGLQNAVSTEINERGLIISLKDAILFDSAKAQIRPEAQPKIVEIGRIINKVGNYIRVEGHTDNIPISNAEFASNWELSAVRATSVARLLIAQAAIEPTKISAVGYGEYRSIGDNTTEAGRAQNRRVDIAIMDTKYNASEETNR
jgi:chemotaxis protein MotB